MTINTLMKEHEIVTITTNQKIEFGSLIYNDKLDNFNVVSSSIPEGIHKHIYVLSKYKDDVIKLGDYCYDKVLGLLFKTDETTNFDYLNESDFVYKVIISSDKSLGLPTICNKTKRAFTGMYYLNPKLEKVNVNYRLVSDDEKDGYELEIIGDNSACLFFHG